MQGQLSDAAELIPHSLGSHATPSPIGSGLVGETCRTCCHLVRLESHKKFYKKCGLVDASHGSPSGTIWQSACRRKS